LAINVEAPMVGKILRVEKKVGDQVEEDEVVVVMEAMKMETTVYAERAAKVAEVLVRAGTQIEAGDLMVRFEE